MKIRTVFCGSLILGLGIFASVAGCGGTSTPLASAEGGATGVAGAAAGSAPTMAGAGTGVSGASGASAGNNGVAGSTSTGATAGTDSSVGGASGSGSGGADTTGGAGGLAGVTGAGTAGSFGGGENDMAAASVLNRYQLLDPCQASYKAKASPGDVCPQDTAVKNQHISLQFGGDASVTYNVTLHVRGIMEGYWYSGGVLDPTSKTFYTGGVPTVGGYSSACKNKTSELPFSLPTEVAPTDNCWNGFNMFAMTVSAPNSHYYLNYTANKNGDRPPHAVYSSDYSVTIPIKGQAKVEFYIVGSDEHECYNFDKVISGVDLPSSPYVGDFVQFDVTNVTRAE